MHNLLVQLDLQNKSKEVADLNEKLAVKIRLVEVRSGDIFREQQLDTLVVLLHC